MWRGVSLVTNGEGGVTETGRWKRRPLGSRPTPSFVCGVLADQVSLDPHTHPYLLFRSSPFVLTIGSFSPTLSARPRVDECSPPWTPVQWTSCFRPLGLVYSVSIGFEVRAYKSCGSFLCRKWRKSHSSLVWGVGEAGGRVRRRVTTSE